MAECDVGRPASRPSFAHPSYVRPPRQGRRNTHGLTRCRADVRHDDRTMQVRDAGGSRTHLNRVAAGRLAVWLQRQERAMSSPGIEPGPRPSQGRMRIRHTPRTSCTRIPRPGIGPGLAASKTAVRPTHSRGTGGTSALARSRTWSATFGGSRANPAHSKGVSL